MAKDKKYIVLFHNETIWYNGARRLRFIFPWTDTIPIVAQIESKPILILKNCL